MKNFTKQDAKEILQWFYDQHIKPFFPKGICSLSVVEAGENTICSVYVRDSHNSVLSTRRPAEGISISFDISSDGKYYLQLIEAGYGPTYPTRYRRRSNPYFLVNVWAPKVRTKSTPARVQTQLAMLRYLPAAKCKVWFDDCIEPLYAPKKAAKQFKDDCKL